MRNKVQLIYNRVEPFLGIFVFAALCLIEYFHYFVDYSDYYFHFLLLDFSHGYMTRGFIGEVVSWFTDTVTLSTAKAITICALALLNTVVSILIGKAIKDSEGNNKIGVIVISIMLIISPMTFQWVANNALQSDLYLYVLTLFAVLFAKYRASRWIVPVLCILSTLVSVTYPVHCMTLIAIVLFYEYSKSKDLYNGIICAVTYAGIVGVALYAVLTRDNLSFANSEELYAHMISKVPDGSVNLLMTDTIKYYIEEYFLPFPEAVKRFMFLEIQKNRFTIIFGLLFVYLPAAAAICAFWVKCIKRTKEPLQRLTFVFAILALFLVLVPAVFTGEPGRWTLAGYVIETGLLFYCIADKNETVCNIFDSLIQFMKTQPAVPVLLISYYSILMSGRR